MLCCPSASANIGRRYQAETLSEQHMYAIFGARRDLQFLTTSRDSRATWPPCSDGKHQTSKKVCHSSIPDPFSSSFLHLTTPCDKKIEQEF